MDIDLLDWLNLAIRWLHVTAGIAWIGASFYFVWLDNPLTPPKTGDASGEVWSVHGGGFYHKQKYPRNGHVVVGYGSGGLAVIDAETHRILSPTLLPGHPESFLLLGTTALVNLPDGGAIVSADFDTGKIAKTWRTGTHRLNFPMANEAQQGWFAVAYRMPAAVQLRGVENGTVRSTVSVCGDADDLFIDRDRIFLICGAGQVDVLSASDPLTPIRRVTTALGARTGLLVPELRTLFIGVPAHSQSAAIWAMGIR